MSKYSERELLMLTQFVYLDCSVSDKTIGSIIDGYRDEEGRFTPQSVSKAGNGGGMKDEDVVKLFTEMDEEIKREPSFGELSASRKLNEDKVIRAICYTDVKDESPVLAIRGTGGTKEAWTDNINGGYETDTYLQKLTADFVKNECAAYKDLTVTGHSKGGNLSQYVTVTCPEMVSRCVSFDGQGFSDDFISENRALVDEASPKIKSISANNDFVNILLTSIAGTSIYVANENSILAAHSGLELLINNEYDSNGNFVSITNQSPQAQALKSFSDKLVEFINPLETKDKDTISHVAGATIATALDENVQHRVITTGGCLLTNIICSFVDRFLEKKHEEIYDKVPQIQYVYFDKPLVYKSMSLMDDNKLRLLGVKNEVEEIKLGMSRSSATWIYAEKRLDGVLEDIDKMIADIDRLSLTVDMITLRYEDKEKTLASLFSS